jgi:hypothetical protein
VTVEASTGHRTLPAMPIACHTPTWASLGACNPLKTAQLRLPRMSADCQLPDISEPLRYLVAEQTVANNRRRAREVSGRAHVAGRS